MQYRRFGKLDWRVSALGFGTMRLPVRKGEYASIALWDTALRKRTPVGWALQWLLWDQPEVSVVLSGMSTIQQVQENVASAAESGIGTLTGEELALIDQVREAYWQRGRL